MQNLGAQPVAGPPPAMQAGGPPAPAVAGSMPAMQGGGPPAGMMPGMMPNYGSGAMPGTNPPAMQGYGPPVGMMPNYGAGMIPCGSPPAMQGCGPPAGMMPGMMPNYGNPGMYQMPGGWNPWDAKGGQGNHSSFLIAQPGGTTSLYIYKHQPPSILHIMTKHKQEVMINSGTLLIIVSGEATFTSDLTNIVQNTEYSL